MYDEVENETNCVGPCVGEFNDVEPTYMMRWKMSSMHTRQYYVSLSMCGSWQSLKGDMAFLDFSSYVSIKDADTVTRYKGLDGI